MCGVFGFIGNKPDLARLRAIATATQRRGHHAFGLAWSAGGPIRTFKRPGPATADLGDLDRCRGATVVIGHCRWATHGVPADNRNNHPHRAGRGWFVHNGVVENYAALVRTRRLRLATECDSEVLGLLMPTFRGPLARRAARVAELAVGRLVLLGIWRPDRLLVVRRGNPLFFGVTESGVYLASQRDDLPGIVAAVEDFHAGVLRWEGGRLLQEARMIR